MFNLHEHQCEYHNDMFTIIPNFIPKKLCAKLNVRTSKIILNGDVPLVSHKENGTIKELDGGGIYSHHIFRGSDIRENFPELTGIYHALTNLISSITCQILRHILKMVAL